MKKENIDPSDNMSIEAKFLEDIRFLLNLSIDEFVRQMGWPNSKYYDYIKNGRKRSSTGEREITHPTINKVFTGLNKAISERDN